MQTYILLYVKLSIGWGQTPFRLQFLWVVVSGYDKRAQSLIHVFAYSLCILTIIFLPKHVLLQGVRERSYNFH